MLPLTKQHFLRDCKKGDILLERDKRYIYILVYFYDQKPLQPLNNNFKKYLFKYSIYTSKTSFSNRLYYFKSVS